MNSDNSVRSFTVAVSRNSTKNTDQEQNTADFIPVVVWGDMAEFCGNNFAKGQRVLVEGRLQVRSYQKENEEKRWITEVVASLVAQKIGYASNDAETDATTNQTFNI